MSTIASTLADPRVAPNAWHAFGGIWRLTFWKFRRPGQLLGWGGLMLLVAVPLMAIAQEVFRGGTLEQRVMAQARFYFDYTTRFYLMFLVPLLAFVLGAGAMRDEMKSEGVDYVLTRPVRRPLLLLFKYISHQGCMQAGFLLPLGVLVLVGAYRDVPLAFPALKWLLPAQVMAVAAFGAFGFICGTITGRYLIIGLLYAAIVEAAIGNVPTQLNRLSMTHQLEMFLQPMLAWMEPALKVEQPVLTSVLVLFGFATVMLAVAATIFSQRELAGAPAGGP